jgi:hypothetical protein
MTYEEKRELVVAAYKKSYDLEVAMLTVVVELTLEDRTRLLADEQLQTRVVILDAALKEELIAGVHGIATTSTQDGVKLSALKDLGRMFYKKRFSDVDPPAAVNLNVNTTDLSKLTDEELRRAREIAQKLNAGEVKHAD